MTYWSIKLFESLKTNYSGAENDDFEEAYLESKPEFDSLLIRLFENAIGMTTPHIKFIRTN